MTETLLKKMDRINAAAGDLCACLSAKEDAPMIDILLNNLERINVVAEILYDFLSDNPRAQVLTEIIIEASQCEQQ